MTARLDHDFDDVRKRYHAGEMAVGVDRGAARTFWTEVPIALIQERTGIAPVAAKCTVLVAFIGGPVALIASVTLLVVLMGWWAAIAIPLALIGWFVNHGRSCKATAGLGALSFALFLSVLPVMTNPQDGRLGAVMIFLFILSLWVSRFQYVMAARLFHAFVLNNEPAFEWLREHIVLRDVA
jgi:hypothetical protein